VQPFAGHILFVEVRRQIFGHPFRQCGHEHSFPDCGALSKHLVESELYGHVKGAFTGSDQPRRGAFDLAEGGTILLDEIGELPLDAQPSLLRVLESKEVKPVGAEAHHAVDARVIATTCRDLVADVGARRFREDLFYRLDVLRVEFPSLRQHKSDIPDLIRHFSARSQGPIECEGMEEELVNALMEYDWPGNVRELRNVVERIQIMPELGLAAIPKLVSNGGSLEAGGLGDLLAVPYREARRAWLDRFEAAYVLATLEEAKGVVTEAARRAEVSRQTFHALMNRHGITGRSSKPPLYVVPDVDGGL
jgi:DNA-binding NtrC family response regulator